MLLLWRSITLLYSRYGSNIKYIFLISEFSSFFWLERGFMRSPGQLCDSAIALVSEILYIWNFGGTESASPTFCPIGCTPLQWVDIWIPTVLWYAQKNHRQSTVWRYNFPYQEHTAKLNEVINKWKKSGHKSTHLLNNSLVDIWRKRMEMPMELVKDFSNYAGSFLI